MTFDPIGLKQSMHPKTVKTGFDEGYPSLRT